MLVWMSKSPSRPGVFHVDEHCARLKSKPIEVDLLDIAKPRPCLWCTDAPRIKYAKTTCHKCGHKRPYPCAHNGGVLVKWNRTRTYRGKVIHDVMHRHVWPDSAYNFDLA